MLDLDSNTGTLVTDLYHAWTNDASLSVYAALRDELLTQQENMETRIATLCTVVNIACPSVRTTERYFDPNWDKFFTIANSIEHDDQLDDIAALGKRKRTYSKAIRMRNLAVIASLWSPQVVIYYGWHKAAQGQMKLLRACALRYPRFQEEFCPRLNQVLLYRHQEAIQFGRRRTLQEAPLQAQCDLDIATLEAVTSDLEYVESWITSVDGSVLVGSTGTSLRDLRPHHYLQYLLQRDEYGMLIARGCSVTPMITSATDEDTLSEVSTPGGPYLSDWMQEPGENDPMGTSIGNQEATVCPMSLLNVQPSAAEIYDAGVLTSFSPQVELFVSEPSAHSSEENCSVTSSLTGGAAVSENVHSSSSPEESISEVSREQRPDIISTLPKAYTNHGDIEVHASKTLANSRRRYSKSCSAGYDVVAAVQPRTTHRTTGALRPVSKANAISDGFSTLAGPLSEDQLSLNLEQKLHRRHHETLMSHLNRVNEEATELPRGHRRWVRHQWFLPESKWARVWTSENSELPVGSAASEEDAEVLYYSSKNFIKDAHEGKIFRKPVVIKETFSDTGMHTSTAFASMIEDASGALPVEIEHLDAAAPMSVDATVFSSSLRSPSEEDQHTLNLRSLTKAHKPIFTMLRRFRLLDSLTERLNDGTEPRTSCVNANFNIAALAGAFSGPHVDAACGTWARVLDGVKFWMFVPELEMKSEWEDFVNARTAWTPNRKQRLVILEKDDVIFIPPGLRLVYAVHSPGTSVLEGGIFWDESDVLSTLEGIIWMCNSRCTANEQFAFRLPRIIASLKELVRDQPDRFCGNTPREKMAESFHHASMAASSFYCP